MQLTIVATKIFELAHVLNVTNINLLPGAWTHDIDDRWRIGVNGHDLDIEVSGDKTFMGASLKPFEIAVWYNGFLAGIMTPVDGILAAGDAANEDTLIAAIDAAIAKVKDALPAPF